MEPADLLQRLVAAYGDAPNWEVTYHRYQTLIEGTYGFFVTFDRGTIALAEARSLVDDLLTVGQQPVGDMPPACRVRTARSLGFGCRG
jgi:hypothetical protein